jgi:hypothetical protein
MGKVTLKSNADKAFNSGEKNENNDVISVQRSLKIEAIQRLTLYPLA